MIQALSLTPYFQVLESHREYFYWKALIYTATGYALYVKDETNTHTHTHTQEMISSTNPLSEGHLVIIWHPSVVGMFTPQFWTDLMDIKVFYLSEIIAIHFNAITTDI